jgi:hypothetical protein
VKLPLHDLLLEMHSAMAIWFAIVGLTLVGCGFLSLPVARRWYRQRVRAAREWSRERAWQAEQLCGYAEEVAVAAAGAAQTARRRQAEWQEVCRALDAAWQAYLDAEARASRIAGAAAFPVPDGVLTPEQLQQRERYLHRSATLAYRRGDLSVAQLTDILSHRNGWSPYRHQADLEVTLRRIARQRRRDAYLAIAEFERTARRTAEVALAAQRALQDEALAAAVRAHRVDLAAEPAEGRRSRADRRPVTSGRRIAQPAGYEFVAPLTAWAEGPASAVGGPVR